MIDPTGPTLRGRRLLVVEDEYLIATEMVRALEERGAVVIGPVGSIAGAMRLIDDTPGLDGALLDINLHGKSVYPVVDALRVRAVPMVFTTGYDASPIPPAYADVPRYEKPVSMASLGSLLAG